MKKNKKPNNHNNKTCVVPNYNRLTIVIVYFIFYLIFFNHLRFTKLSNTNDNGSVDQCATA